MTMEELYEAWEQVFQVLNETVAGICEVLEDLMEEINLYKKNQNPPREYGMSLIKTGKKVFVQHYIPVFRRNLPYQRRSF